VKGRTKAHEFELETKEQGQDERQAVKGAALKVHEAVKEAQESCHQDGLELKRQAVAERKKSMEMAAKLQEKIAAQEEWARAKCKEQATDLSMP
jgi:hypothetical protein